MKQKHRRKIAALLMIILLLSSFRMITFADTPLIHPSIHEEIAAETPGSLGAGEDTVMPLDITFGNIVTGSVTVASTVYYAPHPNVSASTGYTLTPGGGFYCLGREYDYYYIYWYVGTKEMFGYIPVVNTNLTSSWDYIEYDIFRPATCSATTPVLSYAGTTNTYMSVGEIYAGESPLMVLGKQVNPYNNRTYYFVQYQTSAGLTKRGWIDADNGTVNYTNSHSTNTVDQGNRYFSFVNRYTGKALTWNDDNDDFLEQMPFTGALNQTFMLEKVYYNNIFSGHYRILSVENPNMAVSVSSTGYGEGLPIVMATKGVPDKRQEFLFSTMRNATTGEIYHFIQTRSSGEYRAFEVMNGNSTDGTHIIQSQFDQYSHQCWRIKLINEPWEGVYIQDLNGGEFPGNYYAIVESTASNYFYTIAKVQECLDRWNNTYNAKYADRFNLRAASLSSGNRLSTITAATIDDTAYGICKQVLAEGATPVSGYDTYRNSDWYSTHIYLYTNNLDRLTDSQKMKILTHELGHALKLTHTYSELYYKESTEQWNEVSQSITTMDQGKESPGNPTALEVFRLYNKWKNIY